MNNYYKIALLASVILCGGVLAFFLWNRSGSGSSTANEPYVTTREPGFSTQAPPAAWGTSSLPPSSATSAAPTAPAVPGAATPGQIGTSPAPGATAPMGSSPSPTAGFTAAANPAPGIPGTPGVPGAPAFPGQGPNSPTAPSSLQPNPAMASPAPRVLTLDVTTPVASTLAEPSQPAASAVSPYTPIGTSSAPAAATPAASNHKSYTIRAGDTFSSIAEQHFGSENLWVKIAEANPQVDPNRLRVGQVIKLPITGNTLSSGQASTPTTIVAGGASGTPGITGTTAYVVQPGDTLSSIARRFYQSPDLWWVIYNANREAVGGDPDHLMAGVSLRIPPAPASQR